MRMPYQLCSVLGRGISSKYHIYLPNSVPFLNGTTETIETSFCNHETQRRISTRLIVFNKGSTSDPAIEKMGIEIYLGSN